DIDLYSAPEPRISKEVFAHFLCEKLKLNRYKLKQMRTFREKVYPRDVILPYVAFRSPEMKAMLNWFKSLEIDTRILDETDEKVKSKIKHTMWYKGVKTDYGLGGIHGCTKPGIYQTDDKRVIMSADVTSFYPNLSIKNKWAPAHLDQSQFCELYEWF